MRTRQNRKRKKYKKRNKIQLNKECENISLDEKTSKTYLEKIEEDFVAMNERFDEQPSVMLLISIVCVVLYFAAFLGYIEYDMYNEVTSFLGNILYIPALFGVVYYFFAKLHKTKKAFPIVLCINFTFALFYFNAIDCSMAFGYYFDCPDEWYILIPTIIFKLIIFVWIFYRGVILRKKIRGDEIKKRVIPLWVIFVVGAAFAPISTFVGRRSFLDDAPWILTTSYLGFAIMILTMVMTHIWLCMFVYCKIALFGIKEKKKVEQDENKRTDS